MSLLAALALTVVAILSAISLALSWTSRRDLRKLLAAFEQTHGSYPSAAAILTEGREPSPAPVSGRVPVVALPSVARSVVSVTRDDDPIHTRATIAASPPNRARDRDETTRNRLRLVASDSRTAARESWTEAQTERTIEVLGTDLEESELDRVDALAARLGVTRDELVDRLTKQGLAVLEAELDK